MPQAATLEKEHARGLRADKVSSPGDDQAKSSSGSTGDNKKPSLRERVGNRLDGMIDQQDPSKQPKGPATQAAARYAEKNNLGAGKAGALSGIGAGLDRGEMGTSDITRNAAGGAARGIVSELAAKRELSQAKASGVTSAAGALAEGKGIKAAADEGLAAVAQAKKMQQFRLILGVIRGVSAITVVGIVITILIWGLQLWLGHLLGKEAWKMSRLEQIIAVPVWIILIAILAILLITFAIFGMSTLEIIKWLVF